MTSEHKVFNILLATLLSLSICIAVGQQVSFAAGRGTTHSEQAAGELTPTPAIGAPILPGKLSGEAVLVFTRHYTEPGQVRVGERFRLYLEIENQGNIPAIGWLAKYNGCNDTEHPGGLVFESACQQRLSEIAPDQNTRVSFDILFPKPPVSGNSSVTFNLHGPSDESPSQVTVTFDVLDSKPILVVSHHRIHPAQVFADKHFDLQFEIKNTGTKRATGYRITGKTNGCTAGDFPIQSQCDLQLPDIEPGHSVGVTFRLLSPTVGKSVETKTASFTLTGGQDVDIGIQVFQGIPVTTTMPPVQRPFAGAHIEIMRVQAQIVAMGGDSTVVVLQVEFRNAGASEAKDVAIDLCPTSEPFRAHKKDCMIRVLQPLPPSGMLSASKQIVYVGKSDDLHKTVVINPLLSYDFWHVDEWLHIKESEQEITIVVTVTEADRCAQLANESAPAACVMASKLNIRNGPGTNHDSTGFLVYGDIRKIIRGANTTDAKNPLWWEIEHDSGEAWISGGYVIINDVSSVVVDDVSTSGGADSSPQAVPGSPNIAVNPSASAAAAPEAPPETLTRLFIENPKIAPEHPAIGEQFTLTFDLLNPQSFEIPEVVIAVQAGDIIPLGAANHRVGRMPANERRPVSMPLLLQQEPESESVILELIMTVYDEYGQATVLPPERIGFAWVDGHIALGALVANALKRPLWQRFVFGFVGLGAEPR